MSTYIVETWATHASDGSTHTNARLQVRAYDPDKGNVWRYKTHTNRGFDYALGIDGNREQAVRYAVRKAIQQDPIAINYGGENARGYLYIVEVTD